MNDFLQVLDSCLLGNPSPAFVFQAFSIFALLSSFNSSAQLLKCSRSLLKFQSYFLEHLTQAERLLILYQNVFASLEDGQQHEFVGTQDVSFFLMSLCDLLLHLDVGTTSTLQAHYQTVTHFFEIDSELLRCCNCLDLYTTTSWAKIFDAGRLSTTMLAKFLQQQTRILDSYEEFEPMKLADILDVFV